jgi:nucleoid-associated protein YgaU
VTANESGTSEVPSAGAAEDELWLTYLNYDNSIQQAVRRLGALSPENVDVFRGLLLKERKRSRVKEYEAESIRQLQGEAFVGDEALQRALIVLNAEDPRYGEALKRRVAAEGRPEQLDQMVAEIRVGKPVVVKRVVAQETAPVAQKVDVPPPAEPAPALPEPGVVADLAPVVVPEPVKAEEPIKAEENLREVEIVPLPARPTPRPVFQEETQEPRRNLKWIAIGAAILVLAAGAFYGIAGKRDANNQAVAAAKLQAAASATAAAEAVAPVQPAKPPADTAAAASPPAQASSAQPADQASAPANDDKTASAGPALRPADSQPDAVPAPQAGAPTEPSDVSSTPVAGSKYKVVRGDMLSDIALKVYGDAHKWRLIQAANPSLRHKPDYILVDQVILIPQEKR